LRSDRCWCWFRVSTKPRVQAAEPSAEFQKRREPIVHTRWVAGLHEHDPRAIARNGRPIDCVTARVDDLERFTISFRNVPAGHPGRVGCTLDQGVQGVGIRLAGRWIKEHDRGTLDEALALECTRREPESPALLRRANAASSQMLPVAGCRLTACASAAGAHAGASTILRFLSGPTGGRRPSGTSRPSGPSAACAG